MSFYDIAWHGGKSLIVLQSKESLSRDTKRESRDDNGEIIFPRSWGTPSSTLIRKGGRSLRPVEPRNTVPRITSSLFCPSVSLMVELQWYILRVDDSTASSTVQQRHRSTDTWSVLVLTLTRNNNNIPGHCSDQLDVDAWTIHSRGFDPAPYHLTDRVPTKRR